MATGDRGGREDQPAGVHVSLTAPRPQRERARNEYVDTPLRGAQHHDNNNKKGCGGEGPSVICQQPGKKAGHPAVPLPRPPPECSIICSDCGKCRCEACRSPRRPPSVWLCSDFCLCSVDTCVDYASCLCCVKALAYHWSSDEDPSCADDPCSCSGSRWSVRWACLALASLVLPCLCCYCPLRTCADCFERAYASCSGRGCTCHRPPPRP